MIAALSQPILNLQVTAMPGKPTYEELEYRISALEKADLKRKQAEVALSESEERFNRFLRNAPLAYQSLDENGNFLEVNQFLLDVLGYTREELIGRNFGEFLHPDWVDHFKENFPRFKAVGEVLGVEFEMVKKDGTTLLVSFNGKIQRDDQNHFQRTHCIFQDITERRLAEYSLRASEKKYRTLFENMAQGVFYQNADGVLTDYNNAALEMFGLTADQFMGKTSLDPQWKVISEDGTNLPGDKHPSMLALQTGRPVQDTVVGVYNPRTKSFTWVVVNAIPQFNKVGVKPCQVFVTLQDITDRKRIEDMLKRSHDELENKVQERTLELQKTHEQLLHSEKLAAIGGLSASIAHEFNNPLQGVMNVINDIKLSATMDEEGAQLVDSAIIECDRMKTLIKSLQEFNRPTSGRMAPMNVHATIDSILMLSKKEYQIKGITVETNYADLPQIKAVADQIKQVLLNLLNNAAYACSGGGTITISTDVISKESIRIKIQDTGKGIKPEHIDKIFDPFFTTKPAIKGTGLGLSISYGIIKKHGGRIDVVSEVDKGTIFTITLPIAGVNNEK